MTRCTGLLLSQCAVAILALCTVVPRREGAAQELGPGDRLPLAAARAVEFTTDEGTWISLDVSPNGTTIVFDLLGDLYTLPISGGKATRLTSGMAMDSEPRFSPDGKQIAFVSDRSGEDRIWIMDAGRPVTSSQTDAGLRRISLESNASYVSPEWTPDGRQIIATKIEGYYAFRPGPRHLFQYPVEGGPGVDLMPDEKRRAYSAAFGPDGRYLYYSSRSSETPTRTKPFEWSVMVLDRESGESRSVVARVGAAFRPAVSPDGRRLVYATRLDGKTGLRIRELSSGQDWWLAHPVTRDDTEAIYTRDLHPGYAFTPDGASVVTTIGGKLCRIDIAGRGTQPIPFSADVSLEIGPTTQFQSRLPDGPIEVRRMQSARLSPDGRRVLFEALHAVYVSELAGGAPRRLSTGEGHHPSWSPDGKRIAYVTWATMDGGGLRVTPLTPARGHRALGTPGSFAQPLWADDDTLVAIERRPDTQGVVRARVVRVKADGSGLTGILPFEAELHSLSLSGGRAYVHAGDALSSVALDGSDQRQHLTFKEPEPSHCVVGRKGTEALVIAQSHVYQLALPAGTTEKAPEVSLPEAGKRLTRTGASWVAWGPGDAEASWVLGNLVYRQPLDEPSGPPTSTVIALSRERRSGRGSVVFRGARVITMDESRPNHGVIEDGAVVVAGNRIARVARSADVPTPPGGTEIDATGQTILPGFVDTHAHVPATQCVRQEQPHWPYLANLAFGVTTSHNPYSEPASFTDADLIDAGEMIGPRVLGTGPGLTAGELIDSPEEARHVLERYRQEYRSATIKEYVVGNRLKRQWLLKAAHDLRFKTTVEGDENLMININQIIDGYSGIEHAFVAVPIYRDVRELLVRLGIHYTPTLVVSYGGPMGEEFFYTRTEVHDDEKLRRFVPHDELDVRALRREFWYRESEFAFPQQAADARSIVDAGGRVGIGSHGQLQGICYHWEMWALASGGLSPLETLRAATLHGAEAVGLRSDLGSLEPAKRADLLVLSANPLEDIHNTTKLRFVMRDGVLYDAATLAETWPERRPAPLTPWRAADPAP